MLIGRSSRRENLLWVTGVEPMSLIRTRLANHIRASSRAKWTHQQARHMTAPDRNRHQANLALDAGAPSTHDPFLSGTSITLAGCLVGNADQSCAASTTPPAIASRYFCRGHNALGKVC